MLEAFRGAASTLSRSSVQTSTSVSLALMAEIERRCGGPPGAPTWLFASDMAKAIAVPLEAVAWMDALFWAAFYRCDHDDPDSRRIEHQHTEDAQKAGPIQSEP